MSLMSLITRLQTTLARRVEGQTFCSTWWWLHFAKQPWHQTSHKKRKTANYPIASSKQEIGRRGIIQLPLLTALLASEERTSSENEGKSKTRNAVEHACDDTCRCILFFRGLYNSHSGNFRSELAGTSFSETWND